MINKCLLIKNPNNNNYLEIPEDIKINVINAVEQADIDKVIQIDQINELLIGILAIRGIIEPQELVNIKVTDKKAALDNEKIKEAIAKVEEKMAGDGRVLVRPSGTEDLLRVMAEAKTQELVHDYVMEIADVVEAEMGVNE